MKSTNMLERLNQEISRRTHGVRIFSDTGVGCQIRITFRINGRHSVVSL
jgi:hypothetical protein